MSWSEIGSGFEEPGGTPPPRIPRSTPPRGTQFALQRHKLVSDEIKVRHYCIVLIIRSGSPILLFPFQRRQHELPSWKDLVYESSEAVFLSSIVPPYLDLGPFDLPFMMSLQALPCAVFILSATMFSWMQYYHNIVLYGVDKSFRQILL